MARAGRTWWYPAEFQLLMAMNPCPCGNLGREEASCVCTPPEIQRYWRRLGGALLDRVDIRVPVSPIPPEHLLEAPGESSSEVRRRVERARGLQSLRYSECFWRHNAEIPPGEIDRYVRLDSSSSLYFTEAVRKLGLSSRAAHGVLRVARTLADMDGRDDVTTRDVLEALQHRRYGDKDLFWSTL
jgi:magnesium chelatase family protein